MCTEAKLLNNKSVIFEMLDRICDVMNCARNGIGEIVSDNREK